MLTSDLIRLAEAYTSERGITFATLSTYAVNDGKWLNGLQTGAGCTLRKAQRYLTYLSDNWPTELDWPRDIPRPAPNKKEAA